MSTLDDKTREEFSMLLPWYANGTLDEEQSRMVEEALAGDPSLAAQFDLILEDQAAVLEMIAEEEVPATMGERFKTALNAEINAERPESQRHDKAEGVGFLDKVGSFLFPTRAVAYAGFAAALVIVLQSALIVSMVSETEQGNQYQTASGGEDVDGSKIRFLVKFHNAASLRDIESYLKEHDGQIAKGPTPDGMYELEFNKDGQDIEAIDSNPGIFEFVLPINPAE